MRELISVIIPVYNAEKHLARCLESILNQTYRSLEVILVDDGSKDSSPELCDEYARKDIRIRVLHQPNRGVSAARNSGLDSASGKYISFIDADDYVAPDYFERLYRNASEHRAQIACCGYTEILHADIKPAEIPFVKKTRLIRTNTVYEDMAARRESYWSSVCAKLICAETAKQCRFLSSVKYGEDQIFFFDLLSYAETVHLDEYKGYFYIRSESSATLKKGQADISRCLDELEMHGHKLQNLPKQALALRPYFVEQYALGLHLLARAVVLSGSSEEQKKYRPVLCGKIREIFSERRCLSLRSRVYLSLYRITPRLYRLLLKLKSRL